MTNELLCRCYLMYLHQHHPGLLRMHAATVRPKLNTVNNLDDFTSILKSGKELHLIWIRTRITATRNCLKLKRLKTDRLVLTNNFTLHNLLTDVLEWCVLLVNYCDVLISCLDSHSDGTHSLQRIHCWASDGMLRFSKTDEETNSSTSWMACLIISKLFHY